MPYLSSTQGYRSLIATCLLLSLTGCATYQNTPKKKAAMESKNLQLATQYMAINQPQKAITRLDKALVTNPRSAVAYGLLGVIYQRQEEYVLAEESFRKALQIAPEDSNIRNNYGAMLYATQQYQEAVKQFHHVTKDVYYENRDRVFENLGATYLRMGDTDKAIRYYQRALRLNTFLPGVNLKLSEIFLQRKDPQKAYSYYNDFAKTGSQTAKSLWLGIRLAYKMNKPEKMAFYGKKLSRLYAHSSEHEQYQTLLNNESRNQQHRK